MLEEAAHDFWYGGLAIGLTLMLWVSMRIRRRVLDARDFKKGLAELNEAMSLPEAEPLPEADLLPDEYLNDSFKAAMGQDVVVKINHVTPEQAQKGTKIHVIKAKNFPPPTWPTEGKLEEIGKTKYDLLVGQMEGRAGRPDDGIKLQTAAGHTIEFKDLAAEQPTERVPQSEIVSDWMRLSGITKSVPDDFSVLDSVATPEAKPVVGKAGEWTVYGQVEKLSDQMTKDISADADADVLKNLGIANDQLGKIAQNTNSAIFTAEQKPDPLHAALDAQFNKAVEDALAAKNAEKPTTGFPTLDSNIGGFQKGETLSFIGGPSIPKAGPKTTCGPACPVCAAAKENPDVAKTVKASERYYYNAVLKQDDGSLKPVMFVTANKDIFSAASKAEDKIDLSPENLKWKRGLTAVTSRPEEKDFFRPKDGKYEIRLLPRVPGLVTVADPNEKQNYIVRKQHYFGDGRGYQCSKVFDGTRWIGHCPACQYWEGLWAAISKADKKGQRKTADRLRTKAKSMKGMERYYYNVIVFDKETNQWKGPFVWSVGINIHTTLSNIQKGYPDSDGDYNGFDLFDPEKGHNLIISRKKIGSGPFWSDDIRATITPKNMLREGNYSSKLLYEQFVANQWDMEAVAAGWHVKPEGLVAAMNSNKVTVKGRTCKHCTKLFFDQKADAVYCSQSCLNGNIARLYGCPQCGESKTHYETEGLTGRRHTYQCGYHRAGSSNGDCRRYTGCECKEHRSKEFGDRTRYRYSEGFVRGCTCGKSKCELVADRAEEFGDDILVTVERPSVEDELIHKKELNARMNGQPLDVAKKDEPFKGILAAEEKPKVEESVGVEDDEFLKELYKMD